MNFIYDRRALENMIHFQDDEDLHNFYANVLLFSLWTKAEREEKRNDFYLTYAKPFTLKILVRKYCNGKETYSYKFFLGDALRKILHFPKKTIKIPKEKPTKEQREWTKQAKKAKRQTKKIGKKELKELYALIEEPKEMNIMEIKALIKEAEKK